MKKTCLGKQSLKKNVAGFYELCKSQFNNFSQNSIFKLRLTLERFWHQISWVGIVTYVEKICDENKKQGLDLVARLLFARNTVDFVKAGKNSAIVAIVWNWLKDFYWIP